MIGNLIRLKENELNNLLYDSSLLGIAIDNAKENMLMIDKSWDGIIFLLTGEVAQTSEHPLVKTLFSGQFLDVNQDLGYGPAHYLTPDQVAQINTQLSRITIEDLQQTFDPKRMASLNIYPMIWLQEADEVFSYLAEYFQDLQNFYFEATKEQQAIITFIN